MFDHYSPTSFGYECYAIDLTFTRTHTEQGEVLEIVAQAHLHHVDLGGTHGHSADYLQTRDADYAAGKLGRPARPESTDPHSRFAPCRVVTGPDEVDPGGDREQALMWQALEGAVDIADATLESLEVLAAARRNRTTRRAEIALAPGASGPVTYEEYTLDVTTTPKWTGEGEEILEILARAYLPHQRETESAGYRGAEDDRATDSSEARLFFPPYKIFTAPGDADPRGEREQALTRRALEGAITLADEALVAVVQVAAERQAHLQQPPID
ncbi:hypothetical protein [Streptomyces sp. B29(2018)]|uniref:hypothetical protein n=1 Tax=Streptomyces sp. B29(2018) TaxID=2485016 RepID=UPI000FD67CBA|nr:hypothetical protein [Streptomyces sp. B29(2018)]